MLLMSDLSKNDIKSFVYYLNNEINVTKKLYSLVYNKTKFYNNDVFINVNKMLILFIEKILKIYQKLNNQIKNNDTSNNIMNDDVHKKVVNVFGFDILNDLQLYIINTNFINNNYIVLNDKLKRMTNFNIEIFNDLPYEEIKLNHNVTINIKNMKKYVLISMFYNKLEFNGILQDSNIDNYMLFGEFICNNLSVLQNCNNFTLTSNSICFYNNLDLIATCNLNTPIELESKKNGNGYFI